MSEYMRASCENWMWNGEAATSRAAKSPIRSPKSSRPTL